MLFWMILSTIGCAPERQRRSRLLDSASAARRTAGVSSGDVSFVPLEELNWEVRWNGLRGGRIALVVGPSFAEGGRSVVEVRSRSESAGFLRLLQQHRDEIRTLFALANPAPIESHSYRRRGAAWRRVRAWFVPDACELELQRSNGDPQRWVQPAPNGSHPHNPHTLIALLRSGQPAPGRTRRVYLVHNARLFRVDLRHLDSVWLSSHVGRRRTARIAGRVQRLHPDLRPRSDKPPQAMTFWISQDAQRLPLRVDAKVALGTASAELVAYRGVRR